MKIVADANIPLVEEAFDGLGDVVCVDGRTIDRAVVESAEILLVRSVTKVNRELLEGTSVKFVATATIGLDHVDTEFLKGNNIGFASAPGSNANSVAEYVTSAIVHLAHDREIRTEQLVLGIIGVGNVGSRMLRMGQALGMECLLNDPPKKRLTGSDSFLPLERVLAEADVVTVHVPLNSAGRDATYRMVDEAFIAKMKEGAILINTSRGGVVDERHLRAHHKHLGGIVLDVWENEPTINMDTVAVADIATPHIAGYSYDGKLTGSQMVYDAACAFFFAEPRWSIEPYLQREQANRIDLSQSPDPVFDAIAGAYPIFRDTRGMNNLVELEKDKRAERFDVLRKEYPKRLEFRHHPLEGGDTDPHILLKLRDLGFRAPEHEVAQKKKKNKS
ncbi:MAG: 4-phosphoerythronate dehydrogenase [Chitinivibrionales bacterium]|nr:4-phosphoerythronate dehydrogenase [Chitinivibrionales bacterium]MBD3357836.1 4-phosphoerythronate dehydrogenase [Chitinivibrionales bacterium]